MKTDAGFGFPKALHLRSPADFRRVYERKCSVSDQLLVLYGRLNELPHLRLGLSVSRKVGPAVKRNRLRRLYREAFRLARSSLPDGMDLILIPRGTGEPTLEKLKRSLQSLVPALARKLVPGGSSS